MLLIKNFEKLGGVKLNPTIEIHAAISVSDKYLISIVDRRSYPKDIIMSLFKESEMTGLNKQFNKQYRTRFDGTRSGKPYAYEKYITYSNISDSNLFCEYIREIVEREFI